MRTNKFNIDDFGIVRCNKTNKIITVIGNPSTRQKIRYWFKNLKVPKWLEDWGAAAAYAINR